MSSSSSDKVSSKQYESVFAEFGCESSKTEKTSKNALTEEEYQAWLCATSKQYDIEEKDLTLDLARRRDQSRSAALKRIEKHKVELRQDELLVEKLKPWENIDRQHRLILSDMTVRDKLGTLGTINENNENPVSKKRIIMVDEKKKRKVEEALIQKEERIIKDFHQLQIKEKDLSDSEDDDHKQKRMKQKKKYNDDINNKNNNKNVMDGLTKSFNRATIDQGGEQTVEEME